MNTNYTKGAVFAAALMLVGAGCFGGSTNSTQFEAGSMAPDSMGASGTAGSTNSGTATGISGSLQMDGGVVTDTLDTQSGTVAGQIETQNQVSAMGGAEGFVGEPQFIAELRTVGGNSGSGMVMVGYNQGRFQLLGQLNNLAPLPSGYFYEGWIVRAQPQSVVSTGRLIQDNNGRWFDTYQSLEDLRDHTRYVLTLEPNDGDPAPAEHVLEGNFRELAPGEFERLF